MAKKVNSKKTAWYKDKMLWGGIIIFVVIVGGWYYHDSHSGKASKEDFDNAQASIDKVYADIVAKLGPPAIYKKNQSCSRPNQKFSQGPLSCSVSYDIIYEVEDVSAAEQANLDVNALASSSQLTPPGQLDSEYADVDRGSHLQIKYYKLSNSPLICLVKKAYDNPVEVPLKIASSPNQNYYIGISCFGESDASYFVKS